MKNKENWALGLSCIAILLSGYSTLVCDKRIEADWMGILVGILAILTTVLIGWQLFTMWNIKEIQKAIKNEKEAINIRSEVCGVEMNATLMGFYRELLKTSVSEDLFVKFIMSYLYLIEHEANLNDINRCEREINNLANDLKTLKSIPISQEYKVKLHLLLKSILSKSGIKNAGILLDAFHDLNFCETQK